MKHILKEGEINLILTEKGGGLTNEVHLVKHNDNKYILRKCDSLKRAKGYELISKELERYGFFPKFLGRYGKDVLYEYIEGRDLGEKENVKLFKQVGEISAHINKLKGEIDYNKRFLKQVKEIVSCNFSKNKKVENRNLKNIHKGLDKRRIKPLFTKEDSKEIIGLYNYLFRKSKPKMALDVNDMTPSNFRLRKGKVYLVDIEGIKPRIKGFGIAKGFLKWMKNEKSQEAFKQGYKKTSKNWFFEGYYADLCYLSFIIQTLNYKVQIGRNYKTDILRLKKLLKKYGGKI